MRIRWSKFSLQGEEETASQLALFILKDYVTNGILSDKRYPQGAVGLFYVCINFSGESRTWECLPDGEFLLDVPIDSVRTLD